MMVLKHHSLEKSIRHSKKDAICEVAPASFPINLKRCLFRSINASIFKDSPRHVAPGPICKEDSRQSVGLMAHSSLEIANEFLRLAKRDGVPLTQMQLQKLVYLAHGYFLAAHGEPLVEDNVEAWEYGTVFPKLRNATKIYGNVAISKSIKYGDELLFPRYSERQEAIADLTDNERATIDRVWAAYGKFAAFRLSAITHDPDGPWAAVYVKGRNRVIPDRRIQQYFQRMRALNAHRRTA